MAALTSLRVLAAVLAVGAACTKPRSQTLSGTAALGDDVTLYRDGALIRQRIELDLPASATTVQVMLASGVLADQIMLLDRGGVEVTGLHGATPASVVSSTPPGTAPLDPELTDLEPPASEMWQAPASHPDVRTAPSELSLDVHAPRAGKYTIVIGYTTDKLRTGISYGTIVMFAALITAAQRSVSFRK